MSSEKNPNLLRVCLTALSKIVANDRLTGHLQTSTELNTCVSASLDLLRRMLREGKTLPIDEGLWTEIFDLTFLSSDVSNLYRVFDVLKETIEGPGVSEFLVQCTEWETSVLTTVKLAMAIVRDRATASLVDNDLWVQLFDLIRDTAPEYPSTSTESGPDVLDLLIEENVTFANLVETTAALNEKVTQMASSIELLTREISNRPVEQESDSQPMTSASTSGEAVFETRMQALENKTKSLQDNVDNLSREFSARVDSDSSRFENIIKDMEFLKKRFDALGETPAKKHDTSRALADHHVTSRTLADHHVTSRALADHHVKSPAAVGKIVIQLSVRSFRRDTFKIWVKPEDTTEMVKLKIQETDRTHPTKYQLFFKNESLEDGRTMASYSIGHLSEISMIPVCKQ